MLKWIKRSPAFAHLVFWFYRLWSSTWRVTVLEPPSLVKDLKRGVVVFAHWHGDELVLMSLIRRYRIATLSSPSADGELMSRLISLSGGMSSRGSSSRKSLSGFRGLLRLVRGGMNCSFAVDGPKGPVYVVKPGVFELARLTQGVIYSAGVAVSHRYVFKKSWNKTYLPWPFARIVVLWNGPFAGSPGIDSGGADMESQRLALSQDLYDAKNLALKEFAGQKIQPLQ